MGDTTPTPPDGDDDLMLCCEACDGQNCPDCTRALAEKEGRV